MQTIKDICTEYNITQTELSKRFGIPLRSIQDWYSGRRTPPDYVVKMMVELMKQVEIVAYLEAELAEATEKHEQAKGNNAQEALFYQIKGNTITHLLEEINRR